MTSFIARLPMPTHIPAAPTPQPIVEGMTVKGSGPAVYLIQQGRRRQYPDPDTLIAIAPHGWASVVSEPDAALNAIAVGAGIPSRVNGHVYRGDGTPNVVVMNSLQSHHIPDPETLIAQYGGWPAVVVIAQSDYDAIPAGSPVPSVLRSSSVPAGDGTTISWMTDANGVVTAVGANGRKMVVTGPRSPSQMTTVFQFSGPNLSLTVTLSADAAAQTSTTSFDGPQASIQLTTQLGNGPIVGGIMPAWASLSGHVGGNQVTWKGTVNLDSSNSAVFSPLLGQAFQAQTAQTSYFAPALGPITRSLPTKNGAALDFSGKGWSIAKAAVWGLGALAGGALTGGVGWVVLGGCFLTGFDAALVTDMIDQMRSAPTPAPAPAPELPDGGTPATPDGGSPQTGGGGDGDEGGSDTGGDESGGGDGGCFASGTMIAIENGETVPIERIQVDDLIASRNEFTGVNCIGRVSRVWTHHDKETIDLRFSNGETIHTTSCHRVFTVEHGVTDVASLGIGDHVKTLTSGEQEVVQITPNVATTVHNLTVDGSHTYFVGAMGLWVHNDKKDTGTDGGVVVDED